MVPEPDVNVLILLLPDVTVETIRPALAFSVKELEYFKITTPEPPLPAAPCAPPPPPPVLFTPDSAATLLDPPLPPPPLFAAVAEPPP
jgi:hypothetical protein